MFYHSFRGGKTLVKHILLFCPILTIFDLGKIFPSSLQIPLKQKESPILLPIPLILSVIRLGLAAIWREVSVLGRFGGLGRGWLVKHDVNSGGFVHIGVNCFYARQRGMENSWMLASRWLG